MSINLRIYLQKYVFIICIFSSVSCKKIADNDLNELRPTFTQEKYFSQIENKKRGSFLQNNINYIYFDESIVASKIDNSEQKTDYIKNEELFLNNFKIYSKKMDTQSETSNDFNVVFEKETNNFSLVTQKIIVILKPDLGLRLPNNSEYKIAKKYPDSGMYIVLFSKEILFEKAKSDLEKINNINNDNNSQVFIEFSSIKDNNKPH